MLPGTHPCGPAGGSNAWGDNGPHEQNVDPSIPWEDPPCCAERDTITSWSIIDQKWTPAVKNIHWNSQREWGPNNVTGPDM